MYRNTIFSHFASVSKLLFGQKLKFCVNNATSLDFPIFRAWPHARFGAKSRKDQHPPTGGLIFPPNFRVSESLAGKILACGKPILSDFSVSCFQDYSEVFFRPRRFAVCLLLQSYLLAAAYDLLCQGFHQVLIICHLGPLWQFSICYVDDTSFFLEEVDRSVK